MKRLAILVIAATVAFADMCTDLSRLYYIIALGRDAGISIEDVIKSQNDSYKRSIVRRIAIAVYASKKTPEDIIERVYKECIKLSH